MKMQPFLHSMIQVEAFAGAMVLLLLKPGCGESVSSDTTRCTLQESLWPGTRKENSHHYFRVRLFWQIFYTRLAPPGKGPQPHNVYHRVHAEPFEVTQGGHSLLP